MANNPKMEEHSLFRFLQENKLGPIVFISPELGHYSAAGGLGVMVSQLSEGLASLGQETWVLSPYYHTNKQGESNYLSRTAFPFTSNLSISIGNRSYTVGVYSGSESGVNLLFLRNKKFFPCLYPSNSAKWKLKHMVLFAKSAVQALESLRPSIVLTNDWTTSLVPAYLPKGPIKVHIIHNLDVHYEGRLPYSEEYEEIHGLANEHFVNEMWGEKVFNPSRCAILNSDQWATVSPAYKTELLQSSSLREILSSKPLPFAVSNGIPVKQKISELQRFGNHTNAKRSLQKKYFNMEDLDNTCVVLGFVGRMVEQKGVKMILDISEKLIKDSDCKVQILIGGALQTDNPYSEECRRTISHLRNLFPSNFYASTENFFTDGLLVNLGADFALMPSLFEPGGIVQHEFFVAGTPVIAFKTGGLKDTIKEYDSRCESGWGFFFQQYTSEDFISAINRAIHVYYFGKYQKLRDLARKATIDIESVSRAWLKELYRLASERSTENCLEKIGRNVTSQAFDQKHVLFRYQNSDSSANKVELVGSFDKWSVRHPMVYNSVKNFWHTTLSLVSGSYHYKFVVDHIFWKVSDLHPIEYDPSGNINNKIEVS